MLHPVQQRLIEGHNHEFAWVTGIPVFRLNRGERINTKCPVRIDKLCIEQVKQFLVGEP